MQSLLLDRKCGRITPIDFASTVTESLYASLGQQEGERRFPENCHSSAAVNSLALDHSEQRYLLSGCGDSSIKLWDVKPDDDDDIDSNHYPLLATVTRRSAHQFGVLSVKWWPQDSGLFLSGSFDHTVKVWDTNNMAVVHAFDMMSRVYAMSVGSFGDNEYNTQALVAVASDQPFIRLLDLRLASNAHTLPGHKGRTLAVEWHPTNPYILALGGFDGEAKVWDIRRSLACLCRLDMEKTNARDARTDSANLNMSTIKAHSGPINAVIWDQSGRTIYTAGNDDKVRVWDGGSGRAPPVNKLVNFGPLTRNKYLQTLPLVLSPQNETEVQHLFFPSDSGDVLVFRAIDGKLVVRLQRPASHHATRTASIVYGGKYSCKYFCGTMDGEIIVWSGGRDSTEWVNYGEKELNFAELELRLAPSTIDLYDDPYFKG